MAQPAKGHSQIIAKAASGEGSRHLRACAGLGILLVAFAGASACDDDVSGRCSVIRNDGGPALIECDDGTSAAIEPNMPAAGSCSVQRSGGTKKIVCDDGTEIEIQDGAPGGDGEPGAKGQQG